MVGTDVLDDGQSQTGATSSSGAGGVDAVEPLEDPRLLTLGDTLTLVCDRNLDKLIRGTHTDRHPRAGSGVVDGVTDQVADGGREQVSVAEDLCAPRQRRHDLGATGTGNQPRLLDGLGCCGADIHQFGVVQSACELQAGEVDNLLDQTSEPGALYLHPVGEACHRLGIVVGLKDGLGEQGQPADRCLELMADVDDEVAPDILDPSSLSAIVNQQQHVVAAQWGHPGANHDAPTPKRTAGKVKLDLPDDAVAAHLASQMTQLVVDEVMTADQSVGHSRGAGADDGIGCVQDYRP